MMSPGEQLSANPGLFRKVALHTQQNLKNDRKKCIAVIEMFLKYFYCLLGFSVLLDSESNKFVLKLKMTFFIIPTTDGQVTFSNQRHHF